jgi:hypothetical protein
MKDEEVRKRLKELGADIPLATLRRWSSQGLIPKSIPYYKPLKRGLGRPKKDRGKESQSHPGRFSYWTEESLEAAAVVWAIRHLARPSDSSDDEMLLVKDTSQKDVSPGDIVRGQQMGSSLHTLLYTDCKEAANRFRAYLWPSGFSSQAEDQPKTLNFKENRLYSLIPDCIHAIEKVRHSVALNTPIRIVYQWTIREDGSSAWAGMSIERSYAHSTEISLKISHLKPCDNGYSNDYGFPQVKEYMRDGFVDEFWLSGTQLGERFSESPFYRIPEGFYDDQEYADFWDKDPYGWADYATEVNFGDED